MEWNIRGTMETGSWVQLYTTTTKWTIPKNKVIELNLFAYHVPYLKKTACYYRYISHVINQVQSSKLL